MGHRHDVSTTGTPDSSDAALPRSPARSSRSVRRPRVLRVITRLNVGGPATHVTVADRGLAARGWETLLVHGVVEPNEVEIEVDGLDIPTRQLASLHRAIDPI